MSREGFMTLFMISGVIGFVAIIFLLRCLNAFSGELKRSKAMAAEVAMKPMFVSKAVFKQNARRVLQMQRRRDGAHSKIRRRVNSF